MFTKGPWSISNKNEIWDQHNNLLAQVIRYGVTFMPEGEVSPLTQWEDNARLIAAAPDMYKVLSDILNNLRVDGYDPQTMCNNIFYKLLEIERKLEVKS